MTADRMSPDPHMCATCRHVLTPVEVGGRITWHHGFNVDHEVVPVPRDAPEIICDFCSTPNATWVAECTPFRTEVETPGAVLSAQDDGGWAACDPCASYIRRNDWPRLLYRSEKRFNEMTGIKTGGYVAHMQDQFRHHYTGVITRLGDG